MSSEAVGFEYIGKITEKIAAIINQEVSDSMERKRIKQRLLEDVAPMLPARNRPTAASMEYVAGLANEGFDTERTVIFEAETVPENEDDNDDILVESSNTETGEEEDSEDG